MLLDDLLILPNMLGHDTTDLLRKHRLHFFCRQLLVVPLVAADLGEHRLITLQVISVKVFHFHLVRLDLLLESSANPGLLPRLKRE